MISITRPRIGLASIVWAVIAGLVAPASAQTLDHATLEQVFGEPVTSSATGKPQRASDAPVNMEIVTQDDIRRSGAVSIPDALRFVTGIDVRTYGMADAEVGIRGYNQPFNPRLLVLVNGRQVYEDVYGNVFWSAIPVQLEEIRQIEVIKGPNSALYGFNAVSGVINIITYDPLRDRVNAATFRGGTQSYLSGAAVGTARLGEEAGVRVSLGGFRADDFAPRGLTPADAAIRQNPFSGAFNVDGRIRIAPGVEAFTEASMSDSRFTERDFSGTFDAVFLRTNSLRAGITADTPLGLFSLGAYRNGLAASINTQVIGNLANWANQNVYVVQASDLVKLGADHTLRFGLEYRNNTATAPGFIQGTVGYAVYAASLMWNWEITPNLSLTNAVRIDNLHLRYAGVPAPGSGLTLGDYNGTSLTVPSFNAGLVFNATPQDTFRLMAARGVQLPSLFQFGLQIPFGTVAPAVISGNPHLHPSTVDSIEFDYDRALPAIDSSLRLALFAERNRELISTPFAAPPRIGPAGLPLLMAANVGDSNAAGFELGIKGHSSTGFRWNASYAFVATTDNTVLNGGGIVTSAIDYARSVPRNVVTAGIGYTRDRLELDLMARWQSSYRDFQSMSGFTLQPVEVRNYLTMNARAGYRLTDNFTVSVTAQQFNTSRLLQTAGPPVERRVIAGVTARF